MVSERTEFQKKYFKEDKDAVYFTSKEELLEKVIYYLDHDEEREKIRENGIQVSSINKYSLEDRANELIRILLYKPIWNEKSEYICFHKILGFWFSQTVRKKPSLENIIKKINSNSKKELYHTVVFLFFKHFLINSKNGCLE